MQAMECSLTPNAMSLAEGSSAEKRREESMTVLVEATRSAEPPMNPGAFSAISPNTFPEADRVAIIDPFSNPGPSSRTSDEEWRSSQSRRAPASADSSLFSHRLRSSRPHAMADSKKS